MEEIKLEVPVEPPTRSVVLDKLNVAWQRVGLEWHRAGVGIFEFAPSSARSTSLLWSALLIYRGPVRILHWAPSRESVKQ